MDNNSKQPSSTVSLMPCDEAGERSVIYVQACIQTESSLDASIRPVTCLMHMQALRGGMCTYGKNKRVEVETSVQKHKWLVLKQRKPSPPQTRQ